MEDKVKVYILKWKLNGDVEEYCELFLSEETRESFRLDLETSSVSDVNLASIKMGYSWLDPQSKLLRKIHS